VTGVALISFLALALVGNAKLCGELIIWIFVMRILMILTSLAAYFITTASRRCGTATSRSRSRAALTNLVWLTSIVSILVTFIASFYMLAGSYGSSVVLA